jgi:hypothetical protein
MKTVVLDTLARTEVRAVLTGLHRDNQRYWRLIDGVAVTVKPRTELGALGLSGNMTSVVLQSVLSRPKPNLGEVPEELDEDQEVKEEEEPEEPKVKGKKPKKEPPALYDVGGFLMTDTERKKFSIVRTSSGYWGFYSNRTATTTIVGTKDDVVAQLELMHRDREAWEAANSPWTAIKSKSND